MSQVFVLNSEHGLMTAVAAIDAGLLPASEHRVLVSSNSARVPETAPDLATSPHLAALRERFTLVRSFNELIFPVSPTRWNPSNDDRPMLERLLRREWELGADEVEMFVQSPQIAPSRTLVDIFAGAPLSVIGDGLMTYSPIRDRLPHTITSRMRSVIHADIVPGVTPLLFTEVGAERIPVPADQMARMVELSAGPEDDASLAGLRDGTPTALVLGQYLATLGLMTEDEEIALQGEMITLSRQWKPRRVVFKPHPSAPPRVGDRLRVYAERQGMEFVEYRGTLSAEALALRLDLVGAVAGFSTALPTLRALFGLPIAAVGTAQLLRSLDPYENSNRIPVTIIDALTRSNAAWREPERLQLLIDGVGYLMQPRIMRHLRPRAVEFLASIDPDDLARYVDPRRTASLGLAVRADEGWRERAVRTLAPDSRIEEVRLAARGVKRRAQRAWKELRG